MNRFVITTLLIFSLISCGPEGRVYNEHQELSPQLEWLKKDAKSFSVPIDNTDLTYHLSLSFRYITGFETQFVKVIMTETSPGGKASTNMYQLKVKDENGDYIGEPGYEIWDSEHLIEPNKKFAEKGTYRYVISHNMDTDPVTYAMEIGLILDVVQ